MTSIDHHRARQIFMGSTFLNGGHKLTTESAVPELIRRISEAQHPDGGWGQGGTSSWTEPTAFVAPISGLSPGENRR